MNLAESLEKLWNSTGIANFVLPADPNITNVFEQFLHQFGSPIMLIVCLFLLWLGIKKQYEPLLLVPIMPAKVQKKLYICKKKCLFSSIAYRLDHCSAVKLQILYQSKVM